MKTYILGVCGAVILSALIFLLLPDGKLGKFIGGVLKLFCIAVILTPVPQLLSDFRLVWSGEGDGAAAALDDAFILQMFGRRADAQEAELAALFADDPGVTVCAEVGWEAEGYTYRVTDVSVRIEDFGIYGEERHIFVIEQVEACVREWYSAEVNVHA